MSIMKDLLMTHYYLKSYLSFYRGVLINNYAKSFSNFSSLIVGYLYYHYKENVKKKIKKLLIFLFI